MKKILSVFMALCTVLTTLCIPPAPVAAQSTEMLISEPIDETVTLTVEEDPITLETLAEDCKILQYVDEEAFTAADHAFRLPYLEELDTYVFQNTDGTRSIYYLYENVKYIDEQGNIREKDNTLQRETKGFRITENEFDLLLPHAVTDGVELTYQGYDVKLIPATEGNLTATAPGTLQDNSVVYESFFGAGTSLVYTPLLSGVKEEIILEEYLPNQSFSFLLYTDGLYVTESEGRYILTQTKTSADAVLYLGDIVVYDAVGRPSLGNLTVETVKDGNIYALTVSADEAFLADPATVYPVTIDPDLTISDANNGSGAIEDTTIFSGTPNLNAGDWVRNTAGYVDETYGAGRILVRLPGLYNSERFQSLTADRILSATFYTTKSSSKTPDYVNLYRCTDYTWGETTATWNNAANLYATDGNLGTSSASSSVVAFNITSLAKAWRNYYLAPSAGFMLINQNETDVNKKFGIYASEYSATEKRPYCVLNYSGTIWLDESEISIAQGKTRTLIATTDPAGGTVRWNSSNEAVATVSAGVVSAHAPGFTTITATYVDANQQPHTAECVVWVIPLAEGTYFLQNRQTGVYADVAAQIATAGALVQQWEFHGGATQKWELTHISNGYYTLHLENAGSMYYMGVEGNSQITDSNIVLRTGTVDDGMLWRFESTTDGAYRLIPKLAETQTTERALVATTSNDTNGDRLAYGNYIANNGSYRDEWVLDPYTFVLYGVSNSGHDHLSCLVSIREELDNEWPDVTVRDGAIPSQTCKNDLLSTNIFTSRSHGSVVLYSGTDTAAATSILLNDPDECTEKVAFYSHSVSSMNAASACISSDDDYTCVDIALFIACKTGYGGEGARNLPSAIVEFGASASVGFKQNILCGSANAWTRRFYEMLLQGATVGEAVDYASDIFSATTGLNRENVVICGDPATKLPNT